MEPINARHLSMLGVRAVKKNPGLAQLQSYLGTNWLSDIEKKLSFALPIRQSYYLTIIEKEIIIGFCKVTPKNRKGTCWEINIPTLIENSNQFTSREIIHEVYQSVINMENLRTKSFIIKCNETDVDIISVARELGFQPLKSFRSWSKENYLEIKKNKYLEPIKLPKEYEWQKINSRNIQLLWSLEKAGQSPYLRQILDRNWLDMYEHNRMGCGVVVDNSKANKFALIGFINNNIDEKNIYEVLLDSLWDSRVSTILPILLDNLTDKLNDVKIEVNSENINLNNLIKSQNWLEGEEKILLGRSIWKRKTNKTIIKGAKSIESMIEILQPQTPPLPSPTQGRAQNDL